ncbi:nucleoside transporter-like protein family [Amylocarpus encephaloides]|uniref:Nucleoside transporter-like protein family n=1 Tax=Amylocarpus encephaloides TaxID=45428 RepID=A0A9P7Y9S4_9HELO|nr:nucleoside transporter-like protein family [Amylocarpus encephaloides]
MERIRCLLRKSSDEQAYEPLAEGHENDSEREGETAFPAQLVSDEDGLDDTEFSWFEYSVFVMLGIAMLWAWNMFLAAAPYFQARFADNKWILDSFQSAITSVGCLTNLGSMTILLQMQTKADYPKRILSALAINLVIFSLLAISTKAFQDVSSMGYLVFILIMVFGTSVATGFAQNGAFAFAASFGRPEYMGAIMMGQAIAGVLPAFAQILSVLAMPDADHWADPKDQMVVQNKSTSSSAFAYFLTALGVSILTAIVVVPMVQRHRLALDRKMGSSVTSIQEVEQALRKPVKMLSLYRKLHWLAFSVFLCFAVTMFFPVFTQKIVSIVPEDEAPRLLQPTVFIPLGFLIWNCGDLAGRLATNFHWMRLRSPRALFVVSLSRVVFIPLYYLCNIENKGAKIRSDAFYLFVVQLAFGWTNGWLGSLCMTEADSWVNEKEREASGGFMALNLVAGLTSGSLLSFAVSTSI